MRKTKRINTDTYYPGQRRITSWHDDDIKKQVGVYCKKTDTTQLDFMELAVKFYLIKIKEDGKKDG
jgi:hypothetical protein